MNQDIFFLYQLLAKTCWQTPWRWMWQLMRWHCLQVIDKPQHADIILHYVVRYPILHSWTKNNVVVTMIESLYILESNHLHIIKLIQQRWLNRNLGHSKYILLLKSGCGCLGGHFSGDKKKNNHLFIKTRISTKDVFIQCNCNYQLDKLLNVWSFSC